MLKIRASQLAAFESELNYALGLKIVAEIRRHFLDCVPALTDEQLRYLVAASVAEARTFGLESERDLVRFASLTVWIGAKPEGSPDMDWVRTILSDQRISGPSRRLEIVFERILGGQEIAARNRFAEAEFLAGAI